MSMSGAESRAAPDPVIGNRIELDRGDQPVILEADFGMHESLIDREVVHVFPGVDAPHRASRPFGQKRGNQLALAKSPVAVLASLVEGDLIHLFVRDFI